MFCFGTEKNCGCMPSKKIKLVASAGCADDDAAVASMPQDWVPKRGGATLANYLKTRQQNHNYTFQDLRKEAAKVNEDINAKVRAISEELLAHIRLNEKNIDFIVDNCGSTQGPLSPEDRNAALKQVRDLFDQRVKDITAFRLDAQALERERADGLKEILRDEFQNLIYVGHQSPKQLLHKFDDMLYEINQQLLSNCRAYVELEAQLRMQGDDGLVRAKSCLNQLCLGVALSQRRRSALTWRDEFTPCPRRRAATGSIDRTRPSQPIINTIENAEQLDVYVSHLVDAYRSAVYKVITGFHCKLRDLHGRLGSFDFIKKNRHIAEISDFQGMIEHVMRRLSTHVRSQSCTNNELFEMQKSLVSLGECLRDTYTVLHDAGHLWDAHMIRTAYAQKLTLAAVEDLLTSHDAVELANELNFNIALEQLRCMADADKLQSHYDSVVDQLNRIADMYQNHNQIECDRLEQYMIFPVIKANILMSEFHCFLEKYPRSSNQVNESGLSTESLTVKRQSIIPSISGPLPRAIYQTRLNEISLQNWKNGFLETFDNNISLVPDELVRQARNWVDEKSASLTMRYSLKMVSHSIRLERLKAARDMRLAELRHHEARLESHLQAINDLIDRLPVETAECLTPDSSDVYPFYEWIERMQADLDQLLAQDPLDPEMKKLKMQSYAARIVKHKKQFEDSLDLAADACKWKAECKVQEARVSNVRFMAQLQLFSQGGRYAPQEAIRVSVALTRVADTLETAMTRTMDTLNQRRIQLLAAADQTLAPIQKAIEEVIKTKGSADKRKATPTSKKK